MDICVEAYSSLAPMLSHETVGAALRLDQIRPFRKKPANSDTELSRQEAIHRAVDRLPFVLAQVLWLTAICGCSYDEVAAELSITREVVKDRVTEAYSTIRLEIADPRPLEPDSRSGP
ncbi:MAG: sigma factor-like helix-turn-helix DNA-binding protein [Actinomycetota bacterium]